MNKTKQELAAEQAAEQAAMVGGAKPASGPAETWLRPKVMFRGKELGLYSAMTDMAIGQVLRDERWKKAGFGMWAWLFIYVHSITPALLREEIWEPAKMLENVMDFAQQYPPDAHDEAVKLADEQLMMARSSKVTPANDVEMPELPGGNAQGQP